MKYSLFLIAGLLVLGLFALDSPTPKTQAPSAAQNREPTRGPTRGTEAAIVPVPLAKVVHAKQQPIVPASFGGPEHELADDIEGLVLPKVEGGDPFANVAMTKKEAQAFSTLYVEYAQLQSELQIQLEEGSISVDEFTSKLMDEGTAMEGRLIEVMGAERVQILADEMARYAVQIAVAPNAKLDDEAFDSSPIGHATNQLLGSDSE